MHEHFLACVCVQLLEELEEGTYRTFVEYEDASARMMERYQVPAVAIAGIRDGQLAWTYVRGERAPGVDADQDTVFNLASLTKPLFALLTLRLVAEGELELDESLSPHWVDPDVADDPRHRQLTPRLLLSHQGGFGNWRGNGQLAFASDPGARHEYSGEGFEYLRRGIEGKSGMALPALMRQHVLEPGGFEIGFGWSDQLAGQMATGYDEQGRPVDMNLAQRNPNAAAHSFASVADYGRFIAWVVNGADLPDALFQAMQQPQAVHDDPAESFGLGWKLTRSDAGTTLWHDGRENGVRTLALVRPHTRDGLVVLSNGSNGELIRRAIVRAALPEGEAWLSQADQDIWHYLQTLPTSQLGGLMQAISRSPSFMATLLHAVNASLLQSSPLDADARLEATEAIDPWVAAMLQGRLPRQRIEALLQQLVAPADGKAGPRLIQAFDREQATGWLNALRTDNLVTSSPAAAEERAIVTVSAQILADYAGVYLVPSSKLEISIEAGDGVLVVGAANTPTTVFHPASERVFFMKESNTDFEFERAEDGSVRGMKIIWDGSRSEFALRQPAPGDQLASDPGKPRR